MIKKMTTERKKLIATSLVIMIMFIINCFPVFAGIGATSTTNIDIYYMDAHSRVDSGYYNGQACLTWGGLQNTYKNILTIKSDYTSSSQYTDGDLYYKGVKVDTYYEFDSNTVFAGFGRQYYYNSYQSIHDGAFQVYTYHKANCPSGDLAVYSTAGLY